MLNNFEKIDLNISPAKLCPWECVDKRTAENLSAQPNKGIFNLSSWSENVFLMNKLGTRSNENSIMGLEAVITMFPVALRHNSWMRRPHDD